jgi:hypothetical protein
LHLRVFQKSDLCNREYLFLGKRAKKRKGKKVKGMAKKLTKTSNDIHHK